IRGTRTRSSGRPRRRRRTATSRVPSPPCTAAPTSTARRWSPRTICRRPAGSSRRRPPPQPTEWMAERRTTGLHGFAVLTAGATFALLFVGGLVTSTGSGLAVPDWPLSFGMVLPPMRGGVLFEHGHRPAAPRARCLTVAPPRRPGAGPPRPRVRALGLAALAAVALPGALAGGPLPGTPPLAPSGPPSTLS